MDKKEIAVTTLIGFFLVLSAWMYFNNDTFQLKCVVSTVDGLKYCVRENKYMRETADLLARVTNKMKQLVEYLKNKYPDDEAVQRLVNGFHSDKIMETLPTSEHTAYSENKGEKLAFCTTVKRNGTKKIDENTLFFVALHELAHIMTKSIGHMSEFWKHFKFLLTEAKAAGIYEPIDYKKQPVEYCGMKIQDSPYYDFK
jgi:predicted metal-dependent hydrolase